ncbi:MAG: hypothetical protein WKF75_02220, partial [Singulisphaera sp.]
FVVVLAPVVQIPVELEKQFALVEHDLPGRDQLEAIARGVATEPGELPEGGDLDAVLDAAAGLTRFEAENACSLSLVRHGRLAPDVLWELKAGALKKSGLLTLHRGGETFADLGGLDALSRSARGPCGPGGGPGSAPGACSCSGPRARARAAFCRALGNETGRPTLVLDVGSLLGSLVGQSEANARRALAAGRRHGPVRGDDRRGREGARRGRLRRPVRRRRHPPGVRQLPDLAERPRERRVRRLHGQRRLEAPPRIRARRAVCAVSRLIPIESQTPGVWTTPPEGTGLGDPRKG